MNTKKIAFSSVLQEIEAGERGIRDFTIMDHAFILMRCIVVIGGLVYLIAYPYPENIKPYLIGLFFIFVVYSLVIYALIFALPKRIEPLYFVCLSLDVVFAGIFIKLSGGFFSIVFLIVYPLVALHAFYYGFFRGVALAAVVAVVYLAAIHDQRGTTVWPDIAFRISIMFLLAGFLGFISEKEKYDKDELIKIRLNLESLRKELDSAYKNLQGIKSQIEQTEKLASVGRLSAELAHEINNPLDGIKNCLAVIKNETEKPQRKKQYLELIDEAIYDIECAVRNLLDYAKKHEPVWQEVDINGILQRTIVMADYKLQNTRIEVKTSFDADLPNIIGDPHKLQEVFFNVILNAIDAMPGGGALTVETRKIGNSVDIKIVDSGAGIREEDWSHIFQPFYTTKKQGQGTGLGLSVSLEIVRRHDGNITVYSEHGKGAVFSITLPISAMNKDKSNIREEGTTYNL